jgi:hypothetical protein
MSNQTNPNLILFQVRQERYRFETLMKSFTQPPDFHVDYMVNLYSINLIPKPFFPFNQ